MPIERDELLTVRLARDKAVIRAELERRARARQVITYGELAALVGRSTAGLAPVLAAIQAEDARYSRPNLACLAVAMRTALPGGMGLDDAIAAQEATFRAWAGSQ